jgi:predicted peptidase
MRSTLTALALTALIPLSGCSIMTHTTSQPGQNAYVLEKEVKTIVKADYLLYLPEDYEKSKEGWPLIVFLHGAGERGSDINMVKKHGVPKIVEGKKDFPFVVLSPQCSTETWWNNDTILALIDDITARYKIDRDRIYLTGLSMGGFGTWSLAIQEPHKFAAIAPICGGGQPLLTSRIKHLPTWVFHGAKDSVVPLKASEEMVNALKANGGDVKFTVYPDANHDSWTATYDNPELYKWFLEHKRQ